MVTEELSSRMRRHVDGGRVPNFTSLRPRRRTLLSYVTFRNTEKPT
jgi:hypothetical protein